MKESLVCTLLTFVLLTTLLPVRQKRSTFIYDGQSNCVHQTVQGADILADKQLDVNRDGIQDEVVIYGNDDLYALVVVNQSTSSCEIILNSRLTSRQTLSGRKTVAVQGIELVDLTGDDQPELHIWLDLNTPDFRGSQAFHAIYMLQNGAMERIFVISQCLEISSFEFRTALDGTKLIYLDEDRHCDPPSSSRDYEIYRWNAKTSQFERIESGQIAKRTADPFWANLAIYVVGMVIIVVGALIGVIVWWRLKKKRAKTVAN